MQWGSNELLTSVSRGKLFLFEIIINYYSKIRFSCRVCSDFHCSCTRQQCLKPPRKDEIINRLLQCDKEFPGLISWVSTGRVKGHGGLDFQCVQTASSGRTTPILSHRSGGRTGDERGEKMTTQCIAGSQTHRWPLTFIHWTETESGEEKPRQLTDEEGREKFN